MWGAGPGVTSYTQNIGEISIIKVKKLKYCYYKCIPENIYDCLIFLLMFLNAMFMDQLSQVASRRVIQVNGVFCILFGLLAKFGALFVAMPEPIYGGIFGVLAGNKIMHYLL